MSGETFGAMLRRLRQAKLEQIRRPNGRASWDKVGSVSQTELSLRAGLDPACVNKLEAGANHPRRETVQVLAEALELDEADTARLLIAAGFWPWSMEQAEVDEIIGSVLVDVVGPTLLRSRAG